ncbi:Proteasome activator BLM10, partial [Coemansia sp. RSA 2673]
ELMERVYVESDSECKVPVDMRLTRRVRRRFVLAVRTLAMLLLFSKTEDSISKSHSTLKYLAMVEPDLIFAPLLETLYTSIDSVTETHRMLSAMRALAKLATTLSNFSHYPEGAQHVAPLLNLTLPGIDANDTTKTWFTLVFIRNLCFNGVVFEELPTVGDMPAPRASSKASSAMDLAEDPSVDNLPDSLDSSEALSSGDGGLHTLVGMTTKMVLHQCSERYYPMISRLMTDFVTSIGSLSVVDPMCKIVYTFASAMPKHALQSLLPYCCERIAEDIENGVGLAPSLSRHARSHSETTLIWFTSALYALTDLQCGEHLVPYRTQILATFSLLLDRCMSGRVFRTASRALRHIIVSLTRIQPERGRSVPTSVWNDPTFRENHFRHWGQLPQIDDPGFALEWHSRSKQAIDFALELVRSLIVPRISELERFIDAAPDKRQSTSTKDHVYLNKLLGILQSGVCALGEFVPPPGTPIPDDELVVEIVL